MLLFSATVPFWVREVADRYMSLDKVVVDLIGRQSLKTAVTVEHKAICCPYAERPSTIADVIQVRQGYRLYTFIIPVRVCFLREKFCQSCMYSLHLL